MIKKIISGAQTGADRAGLEAALRLGLEVGGTVPLGKKTDAGPLTDYEMQIYCLREHTSPNYPPRTLANVKNSDGTAVFGDQWSPGSKLTIKYCEQQKKPHIVLNLWGTVGFNPDTEARALRSWVETHNIQVLNVAGNRERSNPGIFHKVYEVLVEALK